MQAWNATPVAQPLPASTDDLDTALPHLTITQPRGNKHGEISVAGRRIALGYEFAGLHVMALRQDQHIDVFNLDGTHIRSADFQPNQHYYSNGRPRGGTRRPRP